MRTTSTPATRRGYTSSDCGTRSGRQKAERVEIDESEDLTPGRVLHQSASVATRKRWAGVMGSAPGYQRTRWLWHSKEANRPVLRKRSSDPHRLDSPFDATPQDADPTCASDIPARSRSRPYELRVWKESLCTRRTVRQAARAPSPAPLVGSRVSAHLKDAERSGLMSTRRASRE